MNDVYKDDVDVFNFFINIHHLLSVSKFLFAIDLGIT